LGIELPELLVPTKITSHRQFCCSAKNAVCCKFISWASCYSICTLYYDVLIVCCSAKIAVCCKLIPWASCNSICPLYYDALLRQVILVSINWKISEVDVGGQWVKGLAILAWCSSMINQEFKHLLQLISQCAMALRFLRTLLGSFTCLWLSVQGNCCTST
jgi:hypothetical protein